MTAQSFGCGADLDEIYKLLAKQSGMGVDEVRNEMPEIYMKRIVSFLTQNSRKNMKALIRESTGKTVVKDVDENVAKEISKLYDLLVNETQMFGYSGILVEDVEIGESKLEIYAPNGKKIVEYRKENGLNVVR